MRKLNCVLMLAASLWASLCIAQPAIWQVKGKHNTLYLVGTIHMLPANEPLPANIQTAYRNAQQLVMEIDMDDIDPLSTQATMMQLGLLPEGEQLATQLDARTRSDLQTAASRVGLDAELLQRFQPWLAALTLEQLQMAKLGFAADGGIEMQLTQLAVKDHKTIQGLETLEQQLNLFATMDGAAQRSYLRQTLDEMDGSPTELQQTLKAWRDGDSRQLQRLMMKGFAQDPALLARLTSDRNRSWVSALKPLLVEQRDNYLIAVGALHLVGEQSLVALLKQAGYQVTLQ